MASTRRKAAAAGLAVIGIAGLSLAAAAQLNVGTGSLGANNSVVASCQPSTGPAISVSFEAALNGTTYDATKVTLGDIAAACQGLKYRIQATGASGALGSEANGTIGATATSVEATLNVAAKDLTGVSVVIYR